MIRFALPIIDNNLITWSNNQWLFNLFLKQLTIIWLALQTIKNYSIKKAFPLFSDYFIKTPYDNRHIGRLEYSHWKW